MTKRPPEIYSKGEINALLAQCSKRGPCGARNKALLVVLWRCGLRISEALALRPKDINKNTGTVRVLHGKGDKARTVGLDQQTADVIKLWLERRKKLTLRPGAPLFCTLLGKTLSQNYVRDMVKRLASKADIQKRVHPHGFRHTHSVELLFENFNPKEIQQQLGHSNLQTTDTYLQGLAPKGVIEKIKVRI